MCDRKQTGILLLDVHDKLENSMIIDLNHAVPEITPNPPPWEINYLNNGEEFVIPIAFTKGLTKFGMKELEIRKAPPTVATSLLDRLAIWVIYERNKPEAEKQYTFAGYTFALCEDENKYLVVWQKPSPTKEMRRKISSRLARP